MFCDKGVIEDEAHFLLACNAYSELRRSCIPNKYIINRPTLLELQKVTPLPPNGTYMYHQCFRLNSNRSMTEHLQILLYVNSDIYYGLKTVTKAFNFLWTNVPNKISQKWGVKYPPLKFHPFLRSCDIPVK